MRGASSLLLLSLALLAACSSDGLEAPERTATATATYDAVTRLPIAPSPSNFTRFSWDVSPDATRVAFIGGGFDLYLAEAPDFEPVRLADGPAFEPRWSPDGKLVIFGRPADGLNIARPDEGDSAPLEYDDGWRTQVVRILRWLDDDTVAYEVHCGTSCQHLFEITLNRGDDDALPLRAREVKQVPFVWYCDGCLTAGLSFHYSPDGRYVVANHGGMPAVAWYERSTEDQWLVAFDDDPRGVELYRQFAAWDDDSRAFVYREAIGAPGETITPASAWTCWRANPGDRSRTQISCEDYGGGVMRRASW
jgi:hypothetical protein